jgi:hypothetical protein
VRVPTELAAPAFLFDLAHPFVARVLDLSAGGAMIEADRPLPRGGRVRLRLRADDPGLDMAVLAVVVRQCPERGANVCAIRFDELAQPRQVEIVRYVLCEMRRQVAPVHPAEPARRAPLLPRTPPADAREAAGRADAGVVRFHSRADH